MESDFPKIDYKFIGNTGEKVSEIGLGTYGITDYKKGEEAFAYAIERGIDLIDTAEIYNTEDFVGRIIKRFGRERLFIITKVWPKNIASKDSAIKAAKGSLMRLGTSYVDLILIHWPHRTMSINDQVKNIEAVQKEGLSRFIGVSNFSVQQLEEARHSTTSAEIVCNQVKYSLDERGIENDVLPYCSENGLSVIAYTPIGKGEASKDPVFRGVVSRSGKTTIQVSLNFLLSHKEVIPIPKTERLEHMIEIMGSLGWKLDEKQFALLSKK